VSWVDLLGFLASAAVLATFCMHGMVTLRLFALASNILFATYGFIDHLIPVFLLHVVLFPVNAFRLLELFRSARPMRKMRSIREERALKVFGMSAMAQSGPDAKSASE